MGGYVQRVVKDKTVVYRSLFVTRITFHVFELSDIFSDAGLTSCVQNLYGFIRLFNRHQRCLTLKTVLLSHNTVEIRWLKHI